MSDEMPNGDVVKLPFEMNAPRSPHRFGDAVSVPADPLLRSHPQTERTCVNCQVVKVTVHGADGYAWREWRYPTGWTDQLLSDPPCIAMGPSK